MRILVFLFVIFRGLVSCTQSTENAYNFCLIDLSSKDTLYCQNVNPKDPILFDCPDHFKGNVLVATIKNKQDQLSVIVPVLAGNSNYYKLDDKPFDFSEENISVNKRLISFSGNDYLDNYDVFLKSIAFNLNDSIQTANDFVKRLWDFSRKYPKSNLIGYHIYSVKTGVKSTVFENSLTSENKKIWNDLAKNSSDVFMKELKRMEAAAEFGNCIDSGKNRLVFQSSTSKIHPSLLDNSVKVVIFWATWCGPCKPQMKFLSDLNERKYMDDPVLFVGVTSESDDKVVFDWMRQNEKKYTGLALFHDSHFCMASNYEITQYPTILVFDKQDKLVGHDLLIQDVEVIIDSLLSK